MKESRKQSQNLVSTRTKLIWILLISFSCITLLASQKNFFTDQTTNQVLNECPRTICPYYLEYRPGEFDIKTNPVIAMEITNLRTPNQFLVAEASPILVEKLPEDQDLLLYVEVSSFAVDKDRKVLQTITKKKKVYLTYKLQEGQDNYIPKGFGEITHVQHDNYIFVVRIMNPEKLQIQGVRNLGLNFTAIDTAYKHNLIYFKWLVFIIALVSWLLYRNNISKIPKDFVSTEQKIVSQLAVVLMLITQPFTSYFSFNQSLPYDIYAFLLMAFQSSLLVALWLNLLERLAAGSNSISFIMRCLIYFCAAINFIACAVISGFVAAEREEDPLSGYDGDTTAGVILYKYYSLSMIGIISLWTLIRLKKVLGRLQELDWRDSSSLLFSFYYVLFFMFFMTTRKLILVDGSIQRVVLLFGVTTLYTVLLELLYTPFDLEIQDAETRKGYGKPEGPGSYQDLDMSDMSKKDKLPLRSNDQMINKADDSSAIENEEAEV